MLNSNFAGLLNSTVFVIFVIAGTYSMALGNHAVGAGKKLEIRHRTFSAETALANKSAVEKLGKEWGISDERQYLPFYPQAVNKDGSPRYVAQKLNLENLGANTEIRQILASDSAIISRDENGEIMSIKLLLNYVPSDAMLKDREKFRNMEPGRRRDDFSYYLLHFGIEERGKIAERILLELGISDNGSAPLGLFTNESVKMIGDQERFVVTIFKNQRLMDEKRENYRRNWLLTQELVDLLN